MLSKESDWELDDKLVIKLHDLDPNSSSRRATSINVIGCCSFLDEEEDDTNGIMDMSCHGWLELVEMASDYWYLVWRNSRFV